MKTKGEIEAEITRAIVQFEIDYMGRGPKEARTRIIEDMVLVRLTGERVPRALLQPAFVRAGSRT